MVLEHRGHVHSTGGCHVNASGFFSAVVVGLVVTVTVPCTSEACVGEPGWVPVSGQACGNLPRG